MLVCITAAKTQSPDSPPSSQGRVSSEKSGSQMVKLDRPKKTHHLVRVAYIFRDIISSLHRILRSPSLRDLSNWNGISITGDQEIPPWFWLLKGEAERAQLTDNVAF